MDEFSETTIEDIEKALIENKCFTIKGDFKALYDLGYQQPKESDGVSKFSVIFDMINENHSSLTEFNYSFYKVIGDEVIELYMKEDPTGYGYGYKAKDKEYILAFKGRYYIDHFKLVPSKKPSITAFNWYGQKTLMVTVRGPETEWYVTHYSSAAEYFGKFFDSDLYFGLLRVDYDSEKKTITDVYFKLGDKTIHSDSVGDVVPELKNCSYLKLLNWSKYVKPSHIEVLEMLFI